MDGQLGRPRQASVLSRPHQTQCGGPCAPSLPSPNLSYRLASSQGGYKEAAGTRCPTSIRPATTSLLLPARTRAHSLGRHGSATLLVHHAYGAGCPRRHHLVSTPHPRTRPSSVLRLTRVSSRIQLCHSGHVQCSLQLGSWRSQRCRALGHRQRCPLRLLRRHRSRQRWYQQPCVPLSPLSLPVVLTVA